MAETRPGHGGMWSEGTLLTFTQQVEDEDGPLVREVVQGDKVSQAQTNTGQAKNMELEEKSRLDIPCL